MPVLFYRCLQTLDETQADSAPTWPGSQPTCQLLFPETSQAIHPRQPNTPPRAGSKTDLCWRRSLCTVSVDVFPHHSENPTGTTSPEQQAANPPPDVLLPSLELCHLTVPARSWANTPCATARCSTTARKQKGAVNLYVHGLSSTAGTE